MDMMSALVEQRIKEAMARGEFDNLPGKGRPLELEDMAHVPEELRVGFKLLRNAEMVPEEMLVSKEIIALQDLLALCKDEDERQSIHKKLTEQRLRYRMLMEARGWQQSSAFKQYELQIMNQIEGADTDVSRNNT